MILTTAFLFPRSRLCASSSMRNSRSVLWLEAKIPTLVVLHSLPELTGGWDFALKGGRTPANYDSGYPLKAAELPIEDPSISLSAYIAGIPVDDFFQSEGGYLAPGTGDALARTPAPCVFLCPSEGKVVGLLIRVLMLFPFAADFFAPSRSLELFFAFDAATLEKATSLLRLAFWSL